MPQPSTARRMGSWDQWLRRHHSCHPVPSMLLVRAGARQPADERSFDSRASPALTRPQVCPLSSGWRPSHPASWAPGRRGTATGPRYRLHHRHRLTMPTACSIGTPAASEKGLQLRLSPHQAPDIHPDTRPDGCNMASASHDPTQATVAEGAARTCSRAAVRWMVDTADGTLLCRTSTKAADRAFTEGRAEGPSPGRATSGRP